MNSEIFLNVIYKNSNFWLEKNGWTYNLSPSPLIKNSLPPDVEGIDWFINEAANIKNLDKQNMRVNFSEEIFLGCDASLLYMDYSFGGWIYSIEKEFLKFENYRRMWICNQMKIYFSKPPNKIFISIEETIK